MSVRLWHRAAAQHPRSSSTLRSWAAEVVGSGPDDSWWGRTAQTGSRPEAAVAAAAAVGASQLQQSESPAGVWTSGQTSQLGGKKHNINKGKGCVYVLVCLCLTISAHALCQAFLQTAVLAAVAAGPVDLTVTLPRAGVRYCRQLAAPEKPLRGEVELTKIETLNIYNYRKDFKT